MSTATSHELGDEVEMLRRQVRALQESQRRLQLLMDSLPALISYADTEWRYLSANRTYEDWLGQERVEIIGRRLQDVLDPAYYESIKGNLARALAGESVSYEGVIPDLHGGTRHVAATLVPDQAEDGVVRGCCALVNDITAIRRAELALKESEERFRSIFEQSPIGIMLYDTEGRLVKTNRACHDLFGVIAPQELIGLNIYVDPNLPDVVRLCLLEGRPIRFQTEYDFDVVRDQQFYRTSKSGHITVACTASPLRDERGTVHGLLLQVQDITERQAQEDALRQAQRLESIGLLAGGIAHDFNNLLTGMLGQTSLALEHLGPEHPARPHVEKAVKSAARAADLTRQILAYAGKGPLHVEALDLNDIIRENLLWLEGTLPKCLHLQPRLCDGPLPVAADRGQMQQVVMNLVINAAEAIGERVGHIVIATSMRPVADVDDASGFVAASRPQESVYACLEVIDDGAGIDAEALPRIFDPFYSTKAPGRGLGLSATLGVVRAQGGTVSVRSKRGTGTEFTVLLPLGLYRDRGEPRGGEPGETSGTPALPNDTEPAAAHASAVVSPGAGHGNPAAFPLILVIDDEAPVREALVDILDLAGFQVLVGVNGQEGLVTFEKYRAAIALVVLDLVMPSMDGQQALRSLRECSSDVKILLSSGYDEAEALARFAQGAACDPHTGFLQKPYDAETLVARIDGMLGRCR